MRTRALALRIIRQFMRDRRTLALLIQFIPLVIVPQVFFSGLFNLEMMDPWLQKLSFVMPLNYGAGAMKDIMLRGAGLADIRHNIYILLGFSVVFILLNIAALRKQRAI